MNTSKQGQKGLYLPLFFVLFIAGIVLQSFTSCSSDSSEDPPLPSSSSVVEPSSSSLSSSSVGSSSSVDASSSSVADASSSSAVGESSSSSVDGGSSSSSSISGVFYEGQLYKTIEIGDQTWMAENLNYAVSGSKCGNENTGLLTDNDTDCEKYGRLYDWATAMNINVNYNSSEWNGSDVNHRGICPPNWHIPSNADWDKLFRYVDGTSGTDSPYDSPTAGGLLKAESGWNDNGNGTDDHGFSALPGGNGYSGGFNGAGYHGYWWSSTENYGSNAYSRYMRYGSADAYWGSDDKSYLLSVRCVQD